MSTNKTPRRAASVLLPVLAAALLPSSSANAVTWTAKWIWQAADGPQNSWVCFRKTVNLSTVPSSVIANIGVDSKYWLWINGQMAVFEGGVKRGPRPGETYYDEVEIGKYLKTGVNTIAILATFYGRTSFSHINSGKAGLVLQTDVAGTTITSDASWKVKLHPSYVPTADVGGGGDDYADAFPVDFDASKSLGDWTPTGWTSEGYNDASWISATEKGTPPVAPWSKLDRNPLPPWTDHGYQFYTNYPASKFPITTTAQTTIRCRLPHNMQITPWLEVTANAGLSISIETDDNSDDMWGNHAHYTTKSGAQSFEGLAWMNGNEVRYTFPAGVTITALKYHWTGAGEITGSFESDDNFLNKLWWKARNGLYVNMRDNYMDCPDRERAFWPGDVAHASSEIYYTLDSFSHKLMAKMIRQYCEFRKGKILHAPVPGGYDQELPYHTLNFAGWNGIWWYYVNTGDLETVRFAYPYVKDYLSVWTMNANGLINVREGDWGWIDGTATGYEANPNADGPIIQNCWYYLALKAARNMAVVTGNTADTAWFVGRMRSIEGQFNTQYWKGRYYSDKYKDDRANGIAITSGLADSAKYATIISDVLQPVMLSSPYMEYQVLTALCMAGRGDLAVARMKTRYAPQVNDSAMTSFSEYFVPVGQTYSSDRDGTYNHEWNAPNTILSRYIAGIAPDSPGWATYHVLPQMGTLTSIRQVVPSVKGLINVNITKSAAAFQVGLTSPAGTSATVGIPKSNAFALNKVFVNGSSVWSNGSFTGGVVGITWNGEDATHLKFNAAPGTWSFVGSDGAVTTSLDDHRQGSTGRADHIRIDAKGILHAEGPSRVEICTMEGRIITSIRIDRNVSTVRLPAIAQGSLYLVRVISGRRGISSTRILQATAVR